MPKVFKHSLSWRIFALALLLGGLFFLSADRAVNADETCCITQYNSCTSQCLDAACESACQQQYNQCVASGGADCGAFTPKTPCEECLDSCDANYNSCLASGSQTPQQCAYLNYRCRQRCNTYCIY